MFFFFSYVWIMWHSEYFFIWTTMFLEQPLGLLEIINSLYIILKPSLTVGMELRSGSTLWYMVYGTAPKPLLNCWVILCIALYFKALNYAVLFRFVLGFSELYVKPLWRSRQEGWMLLKGSVADRVHCSTLHCIMLKCSEVKWSEDHTPIEGAVQP